MSKSKINADIKTKLFSADNNVVLSAINALKDKGNKEYLPILFELLVAQPEAEIKTALLKLLGTVKDKETVEAFIDALKEEKFKSIRKEILTTCWQNGLDFSAHLVDFVDLVINEEWEIAFEAFTVIENLETFPAEDEVKEIKLKVARALKSATNQKAYFLEEILKLAP